MPKMPLPPAESMTLDSLAEVARGGMGSVELARVVDGRLAGQILAVKRLHPNIAEDPDFVSMFLDETWMTAALKNPNVAQVVAWGNDDKGMFLAIELVQGVSLSRLLKEALLNQEPFAERTVAFICSQICGGLKAAHGLTTPDGTPLGLVHRDLTPANVLVSFDGMVKIIDFGIAKAEERISHTRTGQLKGKPAYMAPEQQRGGAVDARADIFSFGVVMYELLAGRRPWTAKGAFDVMMEISNDPHPDLGELRKGLNPEFVAIAHKCLQKKPEDRFSSAGEIKQRLDGWLAARGFSADDQHSLAQFVLRNSQPQVLWWQEALRGEHAKKKAPTFKELEERIDEERERAAKAARKAAKAAPPRPAAGTVPMRAFPDGPEMQPESVTVPKAPPSSGRSGPNQTSMMGVAPSPLAYPGGGAVPYRPTPAPFSAPVAGLAGGHPHTPALAGGHAGAPMPHAASQPPASQPRLSGAGTEFMAISPFAQAPETPPPSVATPYSSQPVPAPTIALDATVNDPKISPVLPPSGPAPAAYAVPPYGAPPGALQTHGSAPLGPHAGLSTGMSLPQPMPSPALPAAPSKKGGRTPLVLLLVALVLAGTGGGVWLAADRLGLGLGEKTAPPKSR